MKTRLLPVLLLSAVFPLAALAQGTDSSGSGGSSSSNQGSSGANGPGGTSSSNQGSTNDPNSNSSGSGTSSGSQGAGTPSNSQSPGSNGNTGGTSSSDQGTSGTGKTSSSTGTMGTKTSSSGMASGETFVTIPGSGTWRVNDLQGKTVYSSDGSNIGEINDILISQDGSVNAVIIGVGGFLGMGEKSVAVNINALQMTSGENTAATGTSAKNGSGASTGTDGLPDRIVLNVTRDELEKAPAFKKAASR